MSSSEKQDALEATESRRPGELEETRPAYDAVFGELSEGGPRYRNVGWLATAGIMMKSQIGLGVLGIPSVFNTLGLIPGVLCLIAIGVITSWSNWVVGAFKINHPEVYGIDDVGRLMLGRIGYVMFGGLFCIYYVFVAGSGMLSISISLNALSDHGACTAIFVAVAAVTGFLLASIRTLAHISWVAWVGVTCIFVSVTILTIGVGIEDKPAAAPPGPWQSNWKAIGNPDFAEAITAVSTLVFAYAGTPSFFPIASEMRDPKMFTRALILCQVMVSIAYLVVGVVVYYYCGSYVASPALGSAGRTIKKICYGIALPGLLASTTLFTHLPAKYAFVRILQGSKHLTSGDRIHYTVWLSCTGTTAVCAYLIASGIPVFDGLVSLIGALLGTLLSFQPYGFMWLYDNWRNDRVSNGLKWHVGVGWSVFVIVAGTFLMIGGTYGTILSLVNEGSRSKPWACADNSGSSK